IRKLPGCVPTIPILEFIGHTRHPSQINSFPLFQPKSRGPQRKKIGDPHSVGTVNSRHMSIESEFSPMIGQPPSDRFKSEMPQIPGVSGSRATAAPNPSVKLVTGLLAALLVVFLGPRRALRPNLAQPPPADPQPHLHIPSPAPDPSTLVPHATAADPAI